MPEIKPHQRKNILSDPIAYFNQHNPAATNEQIAAISKLQQRYAELKKHYRSGQKQCQKISRQIGAAKSEGHPVDKLMLDMQLHSADIKAIEKQINEISDNILGYFESPQESYASEQNSLELPHVKIHTIDPAISDQLSVDLLLDEDKAWNCYIESSPVASIYHRAEWRHLIQDVFGHQGYYFRARDTNGQIFGILPLIRLKSRLFGDFMVSMPYFNYGGAVADSPEIERNLIDAANNLAKDLGVSHVEYRDEIAREGFPAKTEKVNMLLPLPASMEELWSSFTSKLRSQVRRPQRENTNIRCGREECLDDFYSVFSRNMRDLGTPVYSKNFFRKILQSFAEQSKIMVVYMQHKPVAAGFLLGHKGTLEIPWASTIRNVNHLSMNMLLYWEVLKFAIENDYKYFDFGRSSKGSGTFRFKRQWGAVPKQLYWHYWLGENAVLPELNPNNPKYALAINIWKRLPVTVTKWIGPCIVRNLP